MNKQYRILMASLIAIVLIETLFVFLPQQSYIAFAISSTPDAYGNRIVQVHCRQWNGTNWKILNDTYSQNGLSTWDGTNIKPDLGSIYHIYVTNQTWWRVRDAGANIGTGCTYPLEFFTIVALNKTLAADLTEAQTFIETYWNITNGGTYTLTNAVHTSLPAGSYEGTNYWNIYTMYLWNVSSHPASGANYAMSVRYTAYY